MRGGVSGLSTPYPIRERLPALYLDDDLTCRFTAALDEVLAPVFATLSCFADYLDPHVAPEDFLAWLADWVAFPLDERWTAAQRRDLVAHAVELHRWRGTRRGLVAHVELLTGGNVQVSDTGGCTWSTEAGAPVPGEPGRPHVTVHVTAAEAGSVDVVALRAVLRQLVPAHVTVDVDVTSPESHDD